MLLLQTIMKIMACETPSPNQSSIVQYITQDDLKNREKTAPVRLAQKLYEEARNNINFTIKCANRSVHGALLNGDYEDTSTYHAESWYNDKYENIKELV